LRVDRRTPPRLLAQDGGFVSFGGQDDLFFVSFDEKTSYLARMKKDEAAGSGSLMSGRSSTAGAYRPIANG
jgi:hypothetical protein